MVEVGGEERMIFILDPNLTKVKLLYRRWQFLERGLPAHILLLSVMGTPTRIGDGAMLDL